MKKLLKVLLITLTTITITPASAVVITATLTADDHYGLYYGTEDGTSLTFVGRNEVGPVDSDGRNAWETLETWVFDANADLYLYVFAWDVSPCCRMWIGEFEIDTLGTLHSNAKDWEYIPITDASNPGDNGDLPATSVVQSLISSGIWANPTWEGDRSGYFPELSDETKRIWHANWNYFNSIEGESVGLYRAPIRNARMPEDDVSNVPLPGTLSLILTGLAALGVAINKRRPSLVVRPL